MRWEEKSRFHSLKSCLLENTPLRLSAAGLASGVYFYRLSATPSGSQGLAPTSRDGQVGALLSPAEQPAKMNFRTPGVGPFRIEPESLPRRRYCENHNRGRSTGFVD